MDRSDILMAAFSARQIAASAALSGYDALAVDFFGDLDLRDHAARAQTLRGHYPDGFEPEELLAALADLANGRNPVGFVYGAGFEDRPELIQAIGEKWPILGTGPRTSRRLKDPMVFASLCAEAGVPHPETLGPGCLPPNDGSRWLSKQVGGCGGSHVREARSEPDAEDKEVHYLQRFVEGARISVLFVVAGDAIRIIGFSRQWADPSPEEPFRYGGAVGPVSPPQNDAAAMEAAIRRFVRTMAGHESGSVDESGPWPDRLAGVASADFVLSQDGPVLLEVNARFGATMDVFERPDRPLLSLHLAACKGDLPEGPPSEETGEAGGFNASGLAWAETELLLPEGFDWPDWTRDRSTGPSVIHAGQPIATVVAHAATEAAAVDAFHARVAELISTMEGRKAA